MRPNRAKTSGVGAGEAGAAVGQPDLFSNLIPPCGDCRQLGAAIDSGIRYCHGAMVWRWASDRVDGCPYRDGPSIAREATNFSAIEAIQDLLESPRHDIDAKGRKWLQAELKRELRAASAA